MAPNNATEALSMNPALRFITDRKYRWLRHSLFIAIGLVLAFKEDMGLIKKFNYNPQQVRALFFFDAFIFLTIMGTLYLTLFYLIPRLLFQSKIPLFLASLVLASFFIYTCSYLLDVYFLQPVFPVSALTPHVEFSFGNFVQQSLITAILLASITGYRVFKKWILDVQRISQLEQMNLKTELAQLRSQINPHFLFNTLNNLFVLTKTDPEKAVQVLLGLSDLLRYQLYDSTKETILLSKDIAFLNNLLALENIRKDDFEYNVHTDGDIEGRTVPPFLFIPFVENAIKHGASSVGHCYLKLCFRISDGRLVFHCENSKPLIKVSTTGGIGLKNIKRRLELLYPNQYTLQITDETERFVVNLTVPL